MPDEAPVSTKPTVTIDPDTKIVKLKKEPGKRWVCTIKGPVKRADINHLIKFMRIEYLRAKRNARIEERKAERKLDRTLEESKNG